ncbi:MAG TPA: hypothetical protein VEU96_00675 [Bryobacteraceae bacterium]|nr:hypothetical protein [Bryobacteraceae bacterium]
MRLQLVLTLLPYLLLAASIVLFLGLFVGISRRLQQLRSRVGESDAGRQAESTEITNRIASLRLRVEEIETDQREVEPPAGVPGGGINSTIRAKVLKLHRLGQPVEGIAEALKVPRGEVDLLVKVHQIVMRPYQEASGKLSRVG